MEHTIRIMVSFTRAARLHKALLAVDGDPQLNFWRVIAGQCMDTAAIEWCKLFGSDHADYQQVHWKNVIDESGHGEFRTGLICAIGVNWDEWTEYREEIKRYRDTHAAHFDIRDDRPMKYPIWDLGIKATDFYYRQIRQFVQTERQLPSDLSKYGRNFEVQSKEIASAAMKATEKLKEQVY